MASVMKLAIAFAKAATPRRPRQLRPGRGRQQWRGVVLQALRDARPVPGLVLDVLYQMLTESGGNPNIVNKWDSNWLAGHPSVGLMQVIRGTFAQYAGPFRNTGPFSLRRVASTRWPTCTPALNYAMHGTGGSAPDLARSDPGTATRPAPGRPRPAGRGSGNAARSWSGSAAARASPGPRRRRRAVTYNVNVKVDPAIAAAQPSANLGRQIAEHLAAHLRSGGRITGRRGI